MGEIQKCAIIDTKDYWQIRKTYGQGRKMKSLKN
jgi:hypothetical protein